MTLSNTLLSNTIHPEASAKDSCRTLDILFIGFDDRDINSLLSLIRTGGLAPRGRRITSREALLQALRERSWDLILCRGELSTKLNVYHTSSLLRELGKDIPLIELSRQVSSEAQLKSFSDGAQALLPLQPGELLVHVVVQQLEGLDNRRRLRQSEALLDIVERHYHERVLSSRIPIGYLNNGRIIFANDSLVELLDYDGEQQLVGLELSQLLPPKQSMEVSRQLQSLLDQHQPIDLTLKLSVVRADHSAFAAQVQFQSCRYHGQTCLSIGITPLQAADQPQRESDALTGLKNGTCLLQSLDAAAQRALHGGNDVHLLYIRLTRYDEILSRHGQEAIDGLIRLLAERLGRLFKEPHLLCRFEADSFALILHHPDSDETLKLARKLTPQLSTLQYRNNGLKLSSNITIGVVTINDTAPPASEILHRARKAADTVTDGNGCALYQTPSLQTAANQNAVKRILNAISEARLKLLFQPIVPLDERDKTHYYEVLIRLLDDKDAILPPNTFMTSLEQSDVMVKLDRWILKRSVQMLHETEGTQNNLLFINIASRSIHNRSLPDWFGTQVREQGIKPTQIVFQISETDAAAELESALEFTRAVRALGCELCLKHFGSSSNSPRVMAALHPRFLKLDGAYVRDLVNGEITISGLKARLQPALDDGATLIAPLVENNRVISKLFHCGVQLVQGYYLQPPQDRMDYDYFGG